MTSQIEVIQELDGFRGRACLVRRGNDYFVVSSVLVLGRYETLAFTADKNGEVTDWLEVAGGRGATREQTIAELAGAA